MTSSRGSLLRCFLTHAERRQSLIGPARRHDENSAAAWLGDTSIDVIKVIPARDGAAPRQPAV